METAWAPCPHREEMTRPDSNQVSTDRTPSPHPNHCAQREPWWAEPGSGWLQSLCPRSLSFRAAVLQMVTTPDAKDMSKHASPTSLGPWESQRGQEGPWRGKDTRSPGCTRRGDQGPESKSAAGCTGPVSSEAREDLMLSPGQPGQEPFSCSQEGVPGSQWGPGVGGRTSIV